MAYRLHSSTQNILARLVQVARQLPGARFAYSRIRYIRYRLQPSVTRLKIQWLRISDRAKYQCDTSSDIIVSLTTFPERIDNAWVAIETILRQTQPPQKIVLVLAEEEFREARVPQSILRLQARGLEILWTAKNGRSYNKLIPTRKEYPEHAIVTVDDDVYYPRRMLASLICASSMNPKTVVGHRGREIVTKDGRPSPYLEWPNASPKSPKHLIVLTGVGGILYPPNLVPNERLLDLDLALRLCPTTDDVWFWAVYQSHGVPRICLGNHWHLVVPLQKETRSLASANWYGGQNDVQIRSAIDFFGLQLMLAPIE